MGALITPIPFWGKKIINKRQQNSLLKLAELSKQASPGPSHEADTEQHPAHHTEPGRRGTGITAGAILTGPFPHTLSPIPHWASPYSLIAP